MKTQLITLESHDDLVSVRDRMSWAKTPRILLIWPKGEKIALRPLDLKMLQRHAQSLGAALGLVTRDRRVRREATALNLPVFESPREAQRDEWPEARLPKSWRLRKSGPQNLRELRAAVYPLEAAWRAHPAVRVLSFALGVLAVLALAALFVPRARITFSTESKTQEVTIPVLADPALGIVFITGGVPARETTREIVGRQSVPATGKAAVPESEAKGVARFRNLTVNAIQIPSGLVVQTRDSPPVRFVTTESAELEAGIGKTVDVPIEAVNAGARGNLDADLIQAIEGPLGLTLAVTNPAPTSGGAERNAPAPSADDRERVRVVLMETLRMQVQREMLAGLPVHSVVFPTTVKDALVLEETYDPPAGETGDTLTLRMRVKFSARYASGDDLLELANLSLAASLEDGFSPTPNPLTLETLGIPSTAENGRTSFRLRAERQVVRVVDARRALALVRGRRVETAQAQLRAAFPFAKDIKIEMSPAWWPWLPLVPSRIEVVIE